MPSAGEGGRSPPGGTRLGAGTVSSLGWKRIVAHIQGGMKKMTRSTFTLSFPSICMMRADGNC